MPYSGDLHFHSPSAGLRGMESSNAGAFSHLHLVGNPDWMSSFSAHHQVAAASPRPVLAPPAPVAVEAPRSSHHLAAPTPIGAPPPAAKKGFLSMFYGASPSSIPTPTPSATDAASASMPAPPRALGSFSTPPQRALPVDAQLSMEHLSRLGTVDASMSAAPRRDPVRPMALGSDTWNALDSMPLPPKTAAASAAATGRLLAPPASIDAVSNRAPKPLWSDLPFTSRFRRTAPTLEAFRNAPPTPVVSTPPDSPPHHPLSLAATAATTTTTTAPVPVPPKPVTTSPLRDAAASSLEVATPPTHRESHAAAHPLVPVGEEARAPATPLALSPQEAPMVYAQPALAAQSTVNATSPVWSAEPLSFLQSEAQQLWQPTHEGRPASPQTPEFAAASTSEPCAMQTERDEARAAANVRNFISTLFRRDGREERTDALTTGSQRAGDGFNALEMVTSRRGAPAKSPQQVLDYSTFFSTSLFDDEHDEDSEEGLEKLRRVVSIVMQSAKNNESSTASQPTSQSSRRGGGAGGSGVTAPAMFPSKYTEFSASYQTTNTTTNNNTNGGGENAWLQFARF